MTVRKHGSSLQSNVRRAVISLRARRIGLMMLLITAFIACAQNFGLADTSAQNAAHPVTTGVVVVVASDRTAYSSGDAIRIRVGLKNSSSSDAQLGVYSPWYATKLIIHDANGNLVSPAKDADTRSYSKQYVTVVKPGQTYVPTWDGNEWWDIGRWGYDLEKPSSYTIEATPAELMSFVQTGETFVPDLVTPRSNSITITIK